MSPELEVTDDQSNAIYAWMDQKRRGRSIGKDGLCVHNIDNEPFVTSWGIGQNHLHVFCSEKHAKELKEAGISFSEVKVA
jgi:hypothetical protein